jgi:hypothetical protein
MSRIVELYIHSPIRLHKMVINKAQLQLYFFTLVPPYVECFSWGRGARAHCYVVSKDRPVSLYAGAMIVQQNIHIRVSYYYKTCLCA